MADLILGPTETAQWHALIAEAQAHCGQSLPEDLESYLVFLLQRYTDKPDMTKSILAMDYLHSCESHGELKRLKLRDVGDKCLLFSGLFPEHAERKQVNVTYFIQLGQNAYAVLSSLHSSKAGLADLYELLGEEFVRLMKLLHCIRELGHRELNLSPLQAEELWCSTGSEQALRALKRYTDALPVSLFSSRKYFSH